MILVLQVVTVFLVSVAFGLGLAHALEMAGKIRLDEEKYLAIQTIYYPGFTIGGISEPLGVVATLILSLVTPRNTPAFWLTLIGFIGMLAVQAVFWLITQPVNRYWLRSQQLKGLGAKFFSADAHTRPGPNESATRDWKIMRNRWEYSRLLRAVLSGIALIAMLIALAS
jgi:hypothetical protein